MANFLRGGEGKFYRVMELDNPMIPKKEALVMINKMLKAYVLQRGKEDSFRWGREKHGKYSVRSGYQACDIGNHPWNLVKKVWIKHLIPKVTFFFVWEVSLNRILILDNL